MTTEEFVDSLYRDGPSNYRSDREMMAGVCAVPGCSYIAFGRYCFFHNWALRATEEMKKDAACLPGAREMIDELEAQAQKTEASRVVK